MSIQSEIDRLKSIKSSIKSAINDPALGDNFSDYPTAITDGKAYIAGKITAKGVQTSESDTFKKMGDNIEEIKGSQKQANIDFGYSFSPQMFYCQDGVVKSSSSSEPISGVHKIDIESILAIFTMSDEEYYSLTTSGGVEYIKKTGGNPVERTHNVFYKITGDGSIKATSSSVGGAG